MSMHEDSGSDCDSLFGDEPRRVGLVLPQKGRSTDDADRRHENVGTITLAVSPPASEPPSSAQHFLPFCLPAPRCAISPTRLVNSGDGPKHYLRSQPDLLGSAGIVAHVKPNRLRTSTVRSTVGKDAENPIIVDDQPDPHRSSATLASLGVNPNMLDEDVAEVLSRDKGLRVVLRHAMQLLSTKPPTYDRPRSHASTSSGPPAKKRRLAGVPANADKWDVPFPFAEGDGPQDYERHWSTVKVKALLDEILAHIKSAVEVVQKSRAARDQLEPPPLVPSPAQQSLPPVTIGNLRWLGEIQLQPDATPSAEPPPGELAIPSFASEPASESFSSFQIDQLLQRLLSSDSIFNITHDASMLPDNFDSPSSSLAPQVPIFGGLPLFEDSMTATPTSVATPSTILDDLPDEIPIDPQLLDPFLNPLFANGLGYDSTAFEQPASSEVTATIRTKSRASKHASHPSFPAPISSTAPSLPTFMSVNMGPTLLRRPKSPPRRLNSKAVIQAAAARKAKASSSSVPLAGKGASSTSTVGDIRRRAQLARVALQQAYDATQLELRNCGVEEGMLGNLLRILGDQEGST